jgi:hypothetical protein
LLVVEDDDISTEKITMGKDELQMCVNNNRRWRFWRRVGEVAANLPRHFPVLAAD